MDTRVQSASECRGWLQEILFSYERSWQEAGRVKSFEGLGSSAFLITPKVVVQMFLSLSECHQKKGQTKEHPQRTLMFTLKIN